MKIIKKYWGVVLAIVLLSTMFVGSAAPVSADNYDFANDLTLPTATTGVLSGAGLYNATAAVTVAFNSPNAVAETTTFLYTDQNNVAGNLATVSIPADAPVGTVVPIILDAGDTGIRAIAAASNVDVATDATAGVLTITGSNGFTVLTTLTYAAGASVQGAVVANPFSTVDFLDVAQANDGTIYATTNFFGFLYKSPAPGVWYPCNTTLGVGNLVAVAPDNSNIVAVVNTAPAIDAVWISTNGGTTFRVLPALGAGAVINSIDISSQASSRFLAIGGRYGAGGEGSAAPLMLSWEIDIATAWVIPDDTLAVDWAAILAASAPDDVKAVAFSEGFSTDQCLLAVFETTGAGTVNGALITHIYSYMFQNWDANFGVGITFPRTIKTATAPAFLTCNAADIALDSNFVLGDNELGFIGTSVSSWRMTAAVTTGFTDGGDGLAETINFTYTDVSGAALVAGQIVVPAGAVAGTAVPVTLAAGGYGIDTLTAYVAAGSTSDATAGVVTFYGSSGTACGTFTAGPPPVLGAVAANIATENGGITRLNTDTAVVTQILTGTGINSVAWDGTNLLAGEYDIVAGGGLRVFRCANALASSGWFLPANSGLKTPGTGTDPLVLWNNGSAYCFSRGQNAAVAQSIDLGKSFDGVAMVNSNFNNMLDVWVSNDGTAAYALTDDGTDVNIWSKSNGVWKRCGILVANTTRAWLVRAAQSNTDVVYLGEKATKNMFKSLDGGDFIWQQRSCTQNIADFAVQNATTVYVAVNAATTVVKTTTGAAGWLTPVATNINFVIGGTCYSINLLADDQLVLGGTTGGVSYSNNGGTSWNYVASKLNVNGRTIATATLTDGVISTGDTIFAAATTGVASRLGKWKIGTNTSVTGWDYDTVDDLTAADITGLVYANGVLYAWDNAAYAAVAPNHKALMRYIYPTLYVAWADDVLTPAAATSAAVNWNFSQMNMVNALQFSTGSTTLWVRNDPQTPSGDALMSYTEHLASTSTQCAPTYPINDAVITVNSIAGNVNNFIFKWNCPPAVSSTVWYTFDIQVFLDEAGTINVGSDAAIGMAMGGFSSSRDASAFPLVTAFNPVPGTTYYWHVRTATPVTGYWSPMQKFNIQQLTAIVPIITAPQNGAVLEPGNAAFSWNPITNATAYKFQLDTGAVFTAPLYEATVTSAGASLPPTVSLERGRTYFWRVMALAPTEGQWSAVSNFTVAELATSTVTTSTVTPVTTTQTTITIPQATSTVITMPPATQTVNEVNPTYIWAIIIIGAVLVLAVIVLIVRTRRSV